MGRAERRKAERLDRIENRKGKLLISKKELTKQKDDVTKYNVDVLMTCFALAEHRLYGFGRKRILRSLQYIDELMGYVLDDSKTVNDYKKELEEETGVVIKI